ncbi:hypothetical protein [Pyxidicoccus sp. MSG2]|nr:hypothetical protein [Pyxidicoccus sp. MSG2]MCY1016083.1 hypothetical protein [Pyxidicoccus sp. MSG2]
MERLRPGMGEIGVLRELKKVLRFDSSDLSGGVEDLDVLMGDLTEEY